jgi:hypothetical protein
METKRTRQQTAEAIAKTIKSIRSHKVITSALIRKECAKNDISEKTIRTIAQGYHGTKITTLNKSDNDE